jgi:excisionase family DNA binding protein
MRIEIPATVVKEYFDYREAGEYVGASHWTVRRWVKLGLLPASRLGGHITRISRADLDAFVAERRSIEGGVA